MKTFRSAVVLIYFSLLGCFPMGLPEPVADLPETNAAFGRQTRRIPFSDSRPPRALLLLQDDASAPSKSFRRSNHRTLGHQFLLGVFPFTRVYLEHGEQSFLTEVLIDRLAALGYEVLSAEKRVGSDVAAAFLPNLILDAELRELSINAYDAIFFRVLSVTGLARLQFLEGPLLQPRTLRDVEFEQTRYRRFGHAPALSALAVAAMQEGLEEVLADRRPAGTRRTVLPESNGEPLVLLSLPVLTPTIEEGFGAALSASYGFRSQPSFSIVQIARIIQRGLAEGLSAEGIRFVASTKTYAPGEQLIADGLDNTTVWHLLPEVHAVVSDLERAEEQRFLLRINLKLYDAATPEHLLEQRFCGVEEPLAEADGFRVVTLELAAKRLARRFMNHHSLPETDSVRCIPERSYLEAANGSL